MGQAKHVLNDVALDAVEYLPRGQAVQFDEPLTDLKVP